ncbi:MAG: hypothetical protein KF788_04350 [Piscinibacter sp.]|nr:hypothetical protein [Piscinibacter sp.]
MKKTPLTPSVLLLTLLAACGGGGGDNAGADDVDQGTAQAMSANSAVIPAESGEAASALLSTAQVVVGGGTASQTYTCPGGGTAVFTATGGSLASLANGMLDAGEVYNLTYTDCRGSAGAASLDGRATLTVLAAGSGTTEVATSTQGITVTLPQRVLTLDGASTLSRSVSVNGADTTTTDRWTAAQIELTSQRAARSSRYTLSAVDLTRSITTTNGVISARTGSGTHTMSAALPNGSWSVTTATQGAVSYDANGMPTQGAWTVTLPHNRLGISVVPGTLTVTVDHGPDGTIDHTWIFTTGTLAAEAG